MRQKILHKIRGMMAATGAVLLLLSGSAYAAQSGDEETARPKEATLERTPSPSHSPLEELEKLVANINPKKALHGFATYYAAKFHGRRTTSGDRYHPDKMTAAHHSLPLGTVVRVVNPANNLEVHVTINDRCAPKRYHFIDLSRAAAKKIGLWGKGKIKVVIIPLIDEPAKQPA